MLVPLTRREIALAISWRPEPFWPDEERLLRRLRQALGGAGGVSLTRLQAQILAGWAEQLVSGHYGRAAAAPEERAILDKLRVALDQQP